MRSGPSLGTWILLIVLGVGSLAAGFGAGLWWQDRDVAPESARWVLTHSAQSAQLTPASEDLFTLTMSPVVAAPHVNQQGGFSEQCFEEVYREEYIPGTRERPGRVRRWTENIQVGCARQSFDQQWEPAPEPAVKIPVHGNVDDNSCVEGAIIFATCSTQPRMLWCLIQRPRKGEGRVRRWRSG